MNRLKTFLSVILTLFAFIVLSDSIIYLLGNIFSYMRKDNRYELMENTYKARIASLEKSMLEYEAGLGNLKVFDHTNAVLAKLAVRNVYDFYNYLIVATAYPVENGSAVVNEDGFVGVVSDASKKTAKVDLLTGKLNLSVRIGNVYGMLDEYDEASNLMIVHNINSHKDIKETDEVLTSGLQELAKDLLVGTVAKIETRGVEKLVYVEPAVDYSNLNYLMVLNR